MYSAEDAKNCCDFLFNSVIIRGSLKASVTGSLQQQSLIYSSAFFLFRFREKCNLDI